MPSETLTVGVVGLGQLGLTHATSITELGHSVAGVDVNADARERFAERFGAPVYKEPQTLYSSDVDAVVVTMPNKYHATLTKQAFQAGLDVYLEKPLAHTVESAADIVAAERDCDQFCMVGFTDSSVRSCEVLGDYLREGWFGGLSHVEAVSERRRGIPGRGTWLTSKDMAGGGALTDLGSEVIHLIANRWTEAPIERVWGSTWTDFGDHADYSAQVRYGEAGEADLFDVEDSAVAFMQFGDGTTATMKAAWATNNNRRQEYYLSGDEGGAYLDLAEAAGGERDEHGVFRLDRESRDESLRLFESRDFGTDHYVDSIVTVDAVDQFVSQMETFLSHVVEGTTPDGNTADEGLRVQRIIDAIYRSESDGAPAAVDVDE